MATFVHDSRLRRAVNLRLRVLASEELEFIVFSDAERHNLVESVAIPPARVHKVLYRDKIDDPDAAIVSGPVHLHRRLIQSRSPNVLRRGAHADDPVVVVAYALSDLGKARPNVMAVTVDEASKRPGARTRVPRLCVAGAFPSLRRPDRR
jgi:hypothetical protein